MGLGSLNCLSAVEAIGSSRPRQPLRREPWRVSIAFRLLKRLVGRRGEYVRRRSLFASLNCLSAVEAIGRRISQILFSVLAREVSIAFRLLKRLVAES